MRSICYIFILFLLLPSPAIRQFNVDSLWRICGDDAIVATEHLQVLRSTCLEDMRQARVEKTYQEAPHTHRLSNAQQLSMNKSLALMQIGWLWLWTLLAALLITGGGYLFQRYKQLLSKQQELSEAVEGLKKKLIIRSRTNSASVDVTSGLDRDVIENAIDSRLGESAWRILNLISGNPAISNKEIAAEVSLSLDGVSSSLRRMYAAFDVGGAGNKKIILARRVIEIIANSDSEAARGK